MNSYAYYNGAFGKREEILVPLSDRSIFFGDAIYDAAIGSYDRIHWESEHIDRFLSNARRLGINHSFTKSGLSALLREIAVKSMLDSYFLYFQLSRTTASRIHSGSYSSSSLLVTVDPIKIEKSPPPLKLITTEDLRYGYCDIKTVNLLPAVLSATESEKQGCDEAIFVKNGTVTECTKSNISIINQGRLITHPKSNLILPGIAREHLFAKSEAIGVEVIERPFTLIELMDADEILVSSTTKLCRRVDRINGVIVGGKCTDIADELCKVMYEDFANFCIK